MADRTDQRPASARIALPGSPASVGTARRFIEARTAAWSFPGPAADQLVLIGSGLWVAALLIMAQTVQNRAMPLVLDAARPAVCEVCAGSPNATEVGRAITALETVAFQPRRSC